MDKLIGKTINKIFLDEEYLTFEVDNGEIITYGVTGDCCSKSVWYDFYGVKNLLGKKILSVKDIQLTEDDFLWKRILSMDKKEYDDSISIYGISLTYEGKYGEQTAIVSFRNYSNGYYGGEYYLLTDVKDINKRSLTEITDDVIETKPYVKEK